MRLTFKSPHLSIDAFDAVDLPAFVVLTGVNGSGKSHLMRAIEEGHVVVEGLGNTRRVVRFDYQSFRLSNESTFNAQQLSSESESAWNFFEKSVRQQASAWRNEIDSYDTAKAECINSETPLWALPKETVGRYRDAFRRFVSGPKMLNNRQAQGIYSLAQRLPYSIDEIERDEFLRLYRPFELANNFLPTQLGRSFWHYYVRHQQNLLRAYQNEKQGTDLPVLSEDDFVRAHGPKPWEVVNRILATFDTLTYRVNSPEGSDIFSSFQLTLEHTEKPGLEVSFDNLSSGERIMMALVASVYKSSSDGLFPDLLLLDEVDASLHPSMIRNMLTAIGDVFLAHGVAVVLVSHSPTTIALSPEESLFVMNPSGPNRIEKRPRDDALSVLTEGFATIEQGLRLFDEVARTNVTVISEGHNSGLLRKALEVHGVQGVEILDGVQGISGSSQLKTIFQFFTKVGHLNKVVVVWDCDCPTDSPQRTTRIRIPFREILITAWQRRGSRTRSQKMCSRASSRQRGSRMVRRFAPSMDRERQILRDT